MSDLQNQTPANTFKGLLQVDDYTNGVDGTSKFMQDGEGTDSALSISTTKVGIGTVNPSASLDIVNTSSTTSQSHGLSVQGGGNSTGSGFSLQALDQDGNVDFFVRGDGNCGIGTPAPAAKLDIEGSLRLSAYAGAAIWHLETGADRIDIKENGTTSRLVVQDGGNVGINTGTSSPGATLQVDANDDSTGAYAFWVRNKARTNSIILAQENGDVQLGQFIYKDGNPDTYRVGLGTLSPSAPLEVASTTGGVIMPRMTTTQMNAISSPTDGEMIYNTTENKFYGRANGAWTALH